MHTLPHGHLVRREVMEGLAELRHGGIHVRSREETPIERQGGPGRPRVRGGRGGGELVGVELLRAKLGMPALGDALPQGPDASESLCQTPDGVPTEMGLAAVTGLTPDRHVDVDTPAMPEQDPWDAHREPAGVGPEAMAVEEADRAAMRGLRLRVEHEQERTPERDALVDKDLQRAQRRR